MCLLKGDKMNTNRNRWIGWVIAGVVVLALLLPVLVKVGGAYYR